MQQVLGLKMEMILILILKVKKNLIYIDTIYNPLETKTLKYLKIKELKFLMVLICLFIKVKKLFIYGIKLIQKLIKN